MVDILAITFKTIKNIYILINISLNTLLKMKIKKIKNFQPSKIICGLSNYVLIYIYILINE